MSQIVLTQLLVAIPAAVAVIIVVVLFLRHLKEERESRDTMQGRWLVMMNKMAVAISELTSKLTE